jgi:hypothetical protein
LRTCGPNSWPSPGSRYPRCKPTRRFFKQRADRHSVFSTDSAAFQQHNCCAIATIRVCSSLGMKNSASPAGYLEQNS